MAEQQLLRLGPILAMSLRRDPSSRHVNRDDESLPMCENHQNTLQETHGAQ